MKVIVFIFLMFFFQNIVAQTSEFVDSRDGEKYKTVKINEQTWMAENLKYEHDSSYMYNNEAIYGYVYGYLYSWETATKICPEGWHLPTDWEWDVLIYGIDAPCYSGGKLKTNTHWAFPNKGAYNLVGFNAMPAGCYTENNKFSDLEIKAYFWSATEYDTNNAGVISLKHNSAWAIRTTENKEKRNSVRCIKDEEE